LDEDLPNVAAALEESNALALAIVPESENFYKLSRSSTLLSMLYTVQIRHQSNCGLKRTEDGASLLLKMMWTWTHTSFQLLGVAERILMSGYPTYE
jgi:hypothetical protein